MKKYIYASNGIPKEFSCINANNKNIYSTYKLYMINYTNQQYH